MGNLMTLAEIAPIQVWQGVRARRVQGDQLTLAIVELDPDAEVPEHTHPAEQNGMVITGEMTFRIADEERRLGPGGRGGSWAACRIRRRRDPAAPW